MWLWDWLFKKKPTNNGTITMGNRKALLVGINKYSSPSAPPLHGCICDINKTHDLLTQSYGFSEGDIRMLTDGQATTANILSNLEWLIDAKPGDFVFFHYSGHGAQCPTGDHAEPDGLSECICPADFDWSPQRMIIDKQFVQIFSRMPSGVVFNWLSDSCHSADLDRDIARAPMSTDNVFWPVCRPFFWIWNKLFGPKNIEQTQKTIPTPAHILLKLGIAKNKGHAPKGMSNGLLEVGFISGCKSNQTSADAYMDGQSCGAATYYFLKALRSCPAETPLTTVVDKMRQGLRSSGFSQEPQAEGSRVCRPFLLP